MAFCSHCGASIPEGSKFCPSCGASVANDSVNVNNQQSAGGGYSQQGGGYRVNIQKRDVVKMIILSIVTCGIYGLIWFFNIVSDLNTAVPRDGDKTPGVVLILSIITCGIYALIWAYQSGEKIDALKQKIGEPASSSAVLYLVLSLFGLGIVVYYFIQTELNKVAAYE